MIVFCVISDPQSEKQFPIVQVDEKLLIRIAKNDSHAFEILYRQSSQALYGFILSILKNRQDAEDILQEAYIKIRSGACLYKPQGKPLAWMFTIARNLCFRKLQRDSRMQLVSFDELENRLDFSEVEEKEDRILLEGAFTILNDKERQVIILHANTGMKHKEIAELLKLPLSTVLSSYRRGLKKLRGYLEGEM